MKNSSKSSHTTFARSAIFLSVVSASVAGQTQLEEVVVTAQKRNQSLQDVPVSVQAIGSDELRQNSVQSLADVSVLSPGLTIVNTQSQVGTEIGIRGISTSTIGVGVESSTAVYLDGVYQSNLLAIARLVDVAQIEVLRGPQGTLFGRNAAAGAVSIRSNGPSDEVEGFIGLGAGSEGFGNLEGVLNMPLTDDILSRTSFSYSFRDGWQDDTDSPGASDLYEIDGLAARTQINWFISDSFNALLALDYAKEDGTRGGFILEEGASLIPTAGFATTHTIDGTRAGVSGFVFEDGLPQPYGSDSESDTTGASLTLDWDLGDDLSLVSISSYRDSDIKMVGAPGGLFSVEAGAVPYLPPYIGPERYSFETLNQEFRLSGMSDSADWFLGLNYFSQTSQQDINYALPLFATLGLATGELGDAQSIAEVDTESFAVFGDVIFFINEKLNLTAGLRYSYDEKEVSWGDVTQKAPGLFYPDISGGIVVDSGFEAAARDDWDNISGRLVLDYVFTDGAMVYVSASQGYKSGGFNSELFPGADPASSFDPEESTSYELGAKLSLLDESISLNFAAFFNEYDNYQFQVAVPGALAAANLGADAEISGFELDATWRVSGGLTVSAAASFLDSEYLEDVTVTGPGGTAFATRKGNELMRAPEWAGRISADYVHQVSDLGELRMNLSYAYSDSYRLGNADVESLQGNGIVFEESDLYSGSYGLLNARLSFTDRSGAWNVSLWGTNLTDEAYREDDYIDVSNSVYGQLASSARVYSRNTPRLYGIDLRYSF